jgi:hypothetical protein
MDYLCRHPVAVSATGLSHVPGRTENMAFLTLFFEGSQIAHIHVNWLAPVKVRRTLIGASKKMIVYDDLEQSEKIKVYDKGITLNRQKDPAEKMYQALVGYRTGDMLAPNLDMSEALRVEAAHFVRCIAERKQPLTDGQAGLRVVQILEAATESMRHKGRPVELPVAIPSSADPNPSQESLMAPQHCRDGSLPRPEGAVPQHQAGDRRGHREDPGEQPVRAGRGGGRLRAGVRRLQRRRPRHRPELGHERAAPRVPGGRDRPRRRGDHDPTRSWPR